jgi:acetoin utilization deacetylase AcuC-like enzyme
MSVALYTHAEMFGHQPGPGHPERPERLAAVLAALEAASDLSLERRTAPLAERADLLRVHAAGHIEALFAAAPPPGGTVRLDPDTALSPGSLGAALRAAGATVAATRAVIAGEIDRAFCAVRPPGHHAEADRAMGFCLFSNVAVAAKAALAAGVARVGVIDFDVHHGNGTQDVALGDPSLFFASVHQWPAYPGGGAPSERGQGNVRNAVCAPGSTRAAWRAAFESLMDPLDAFAPELILISAGFDAHARDPLAELTLEAEDFAWATRAICTIARRHGGGRIVSSLEGGYDLAALGQSALEHVRALQEG